MEALLLAVHGGPTMLARIGIMKALNRHVVREFKQGKRRRFGENGSWHATADPAKSARLL
jgi:hypothetical protein